METNSQPDAQSLQPQIVSENMQLEMPTEKLQLKMHSDSSTRVTGESGGRIADSSSFGDISDISKLSLESSSTLPRCHCNLKTKIDPDTNKKRFYFYRSGKVLHFYDKKFYQLFPSFNLLFPPKIVFSLCCGTIIAPA